MWTFWSKLWTFVLLIGVTLAVIDKPCNDQYTDCDAGECCATISSSEEGFKGSCQKYLRFNDECTPGELKEGECGCGRWSVCATYDLGGEGVTHKCSILLPGRR